MTDSFSSRCLQITCLLSISTIITGLHSQSRSLGVVKCVTSSHNSINHLPSPFPLHTKNRYFSLKNVPATIENNGPIESVDEILGMIKDTDKGADASVELQETVYNWVTKKSKEYSEKLKILNKNKNQEEQQVIIGKDDKLYVVETVKKGGDDNELTVLDDENIYGNYDVSFVSTVKANRQQGNPAGGNFRGTFGRFIFENEGLYQHILKEDDINYGNEDKKDKKGAKDTKDKGNKNTKSGFYSKENAVSAVSTSSIEPAKKSRTLVVNYITGKLFKFITVSVILKGVISRLTEAERTGLTEQYGTALSSGTIRANFESPLITIGGFSVSAGPKSDVVLDTPYLDEKIRLGMGARGSLFIFKRNTEEKANNWIIDVKRKSSNAKILGRILLFAGGFLAVTATTLENIVLRVFNGFLAIPLILFGMLFLFSKGGIRDDPLIMGKAK